MHHLSVSPDSVKYLVVRNFCYVEFLRYYYVTSTNTNENYCQPRELKDDIIEENQNSQKYYPKVIKLFSAKGKLQ